LDVFWTDIWRAIPQIWEESKENEKKEKVKKSKERKKIRK